MKRPTMATVKSFVKKNHGSMFINIKSSFNGMVDGCDYHKGSKFKEVEHKDTHLENTLGIHGAWFVRGRSGDSVSEYNDGCFIGYEIYNCCGSFILATKAA